MAHGQITHIELPADAVARARRFNPCGDLLRVRVGSPAKAGDPALPCG